MAVERLTSTQTQMRMRWQDWVNVSLGAWLIIAPLVGVGQVNDAAAWNSYLMGTLVAVVAAAAIVRVRLWEEWTNLFAGVWLILAPFSLHFVDQPDALWNQIIVGALIVTTSGWVLRSLKSAAENA